MKNLPSSSSTNMVSGIWFVHREPEVILRAWLSTLNGKEKIYANEELISEKRNITRLTTLHEFNYEGAQFDLEIFASNIMLMELECNIFRDGRLISAKVNRYLLKGGAGAYEIQDNEKKEAIVKRALDRFKKKGIRELNEYDLPAAKSYFRKTLSIEENHPESFFLLACVASLEEDKTTAFKMLEKALAAGLTGRDRIMKEDKLAFIRVQPEFQSFSQLHFGDPGGEN